MLCATCGMTKYGLQHLSGDKLGFGWKNERMVIEKL